MWTATRAIFPYGGGAVSHTALPKSRQPSMDFLSRKTIYLRQDHLFNTMHGYLFITLSKRTLSRELIFFRFF
jgi:hypothetical protein